MIPAGLFQLKRVAIFFVGHSIRTMAKTLIGLLTILFVSLTLPGCGSGGYADEAPPVPPTKAEQLRQFLYEHSSTSMQQWSGSDAGKEHQSLLTHFADLGAETTLFEIRYAYTNLPQLTVLLSKPGNRRLVVYNHGHGGFPAASETFVHQFLLLLLGNGYDVLYASMPLVGANTPDPGGSYWIKTRGTSEPATVALDVLAMLGHEIYEYIDDPDHYMHYFIDGTLLPLQVIGDGYDAVSYVGLSGGGATGLVACSVRRFEKCILIASFLPDYLRVSSAADVGDIEQFTRSFYQSFNVQDLMQLARRNSDWLAMYLNRNDPCCFADPGASEFQRRFPDYDIVLTDLDIHGFDAVEIFNALVAGEH